MTLGGFHTDWVSGPELYHIITNEPWLAGHLPPPGARQPWRPIGSTAAFASRIDDATLKCNLVQLTRGTVRPDTPVCCVRREGKERQGKTNGVDPATGAPQMAKPNPAFQKECPQWALHRNRQKQRILHYRPDWLLTLRHPAWTAQKFILKGKSTVYKFSP